MAVGVIVEHVLGGALVTTRWLLESNVMDGVEERKDVGESSWFEPHLLALVVSLVRLKEALVHWLQVLLIHVAWDH